MKHYVFGSWTQNTNQQFSTEARRHHETDQVVHINSSRPTTTGTQLATDWSWPHGEPAQNGRHFGNDITLRWRQNVRDSVSNHQPHHCLLNRYSDADQRKHQSSVSLAFVRGIQRGPVNPPHKWPVARKMFPFDDVIMIKYLVLHRWQVIVWTNAGTVYLHLERHRAVSRELS